MAVHTFRFSVNDKEKPAIFTYDPNRDWTYNAHDTLRFVTDAGPFTLDLIRKDSAPVPGMKRPFPVLTSTPVGKEHVAETTIDDGLNPQQRDDARNRNATPDNPFGFIARYRYKIEVTLPYTEPAVDDQKNGEYRC